MTIDHLAQEIEEISERIKNLKYTFSNKSDGQQAEETKQRAIDDLEEFLDMATADSES